MPKLEAYQQRKRHFSEEKKSELQDQFLRGQLIPESMADYGSLALSLPT
jgi:hypothetical protein